MPSFKTEVIGYDQRAEFYHLEQDGKHDFEFYQRQACQHRGPGLVIPCGAGRLLGALGNLNNIVYADLEPQMIEQVRRHLDQRGKAISDAQIINLLSIEFSPEQKFEMIVIPAEAIQMFSENDVCCILQNLATLLSPTGCILVDIAHFRSTPQTSAEAPSYYDKTQNGKQWLSWERKNGDSIISRYVTHQEQHYFIDFTFDYVIRRANEVTNHQAKLKLWRHSEETIRIACLSASLEITETFNSYSERETSEPQRTIVKLSQKAVPKSA
ncbi:methyltransferase domain-containing protein [Pseudomonas sp. COR18]|uniref:methyltransferase domain-containing protein n=1 Tax=Pseudomonas sp. COR18 TaxID=3399680 RepID=UPI003B000721